MSLKPIQSALISVYYKDNLEPIIELLKKHGVTMYSTGGTQSFIESLGGEVVPVEELTSYPSILGGRVKTLHPKVFGGILNRRDHATDKQEVAEYEIPNIDLVIVDLYPFEETVASGASEADIIEKIDIGGIALIRAAAKNFEDVVIVPSRDYYKELEGILSNQSGATSLEDRKRFSSYAFDVSSHYDGAIYKYMAGENASGFKKSLKGAKTLRYGENPHQQGTFYGDLSQMFDQLHGKELSYNNLVDVDAAVSLIAEFSGETAFVILKHTNACGVATGSTVQEAYRKAFEADTVSAFGGVLVCNQTIDLPAAEEMNSLFFEILIAPGFTAEALEVLQTKKNRILLVQKEEKKAQKEFKSLLNGVLEQDRDLKMESAAELKPVTEKLPSEDEKKALLFAAKICKHTKSNVIVLAKNGQLMASGVGQTSRVDALEQAILKAKRFGFDLKESVMASDAFFPFSDCVEKACAEGIKVVIQPGGSVRDQDSIDFCNQNDMSMVFTGIRHFKH